MCLFGMMIMYRGLVIQFKEGNELRAQADSMHTKIEVIQPERGNIFSEDGSLLSSSIPEFDLHVDFTAIKKDTFNKYIESLSVNIAAILKDKSAVDYKEILSNEFKNKNKYFLLKKKASYAQYLELKKVEPFKKGMNKGGFISEAKTKRINPASQTKAHCPKTRCTRTGLHVTQTSKRVQRLVCLQSKTGNCNITTKGESGLFRELDFGIGA
jgi:cell division protein FtsI (penicillin-binding protein 3)